MKLSKKELAELADTEPPPAERKPYLLTDAERDDIRSVLKGAELGAEHWVRIARVLNANPGEQKARAARMRYLASLLAVLLLACGAEQWPPPYYVYFEADVPQAERDVFGAAAAAWNEAVGAEPVFWVGSEAADGACGVEVARTTRSAAEPAEALQGACLTRIEYDPRYLQPCIAVHELGHKLGLGHVPGTVMAEYGCDYPAIVTPALADMVRERWGRDGNL